jgi:phenylpropionate dioxygenase-like ring-hydroxylating dioxygenase large terminal subunit
MRVAALSERLAAHLRNRTQDVGPAAHSRPVADYTDPDRYAREVQALFRELPIVVAHSSQIPHPGDFLTDDRLGVPVLLVRTETGTVAAYINVCIHRSAIVEPARSGRRTHFTCPYHSWMYGLDGSLLRMTDDSAFECLDPPPRGLTPLAVAEKYGLIFVRIAPGPPLDIDAFLGPMAQELEVLDIGAHRYFATKQTELACNWKVVQEGSLETYHFNGVHTQTIARQYNGMARVFDAFGDHQRFVVPRRKLLERLEQGAAARDQLLPTYFIFPNTALTVPHDHMMLVQVFPRDLRRCLFENTLLIRTDGDVTNEGHWQRALDLTQSVNEEDFTVVESIQKAYDSAPPERVIHGRNEQGITAFHAVIDRLLRSISHAETAQPDGGCFVCIRCTAAPSVSPMRAWTTRSARSSIGVGSALMMTSPAPRCFARSGMSAAGNTVREEPSTSIKSQRAASCSARRISSTGML